MVLSGKLRHAAFVTDAADQQGDDHGQQDQGYQDVAGADRQASDRDAGCGQRSGDDRKDLSSDFAVDWMLLRNGGLFFCNRS